MGKNSLYGIENIYFAQIRVDAWNIQTTLDCW